MLPIDEAALFLKNHAIMDLKIVSKQKQALEHLLFLLGNGPIFEESVHRGMFLWPGVKDFLVQLFDSLDRGLETKATEIFYCGWDCIVNFVGSDNTHLVLKSFLEAIAKRFPSSQELYHRQQACILAEIFQPTAEDFLVSFPTDKFSVEFPNVYELFILHLEKSRDL